MGWATISFSLISLLTGLPGLVTQGLYSQGLILGFILGAVAE